MTKETLEKAKELDKTITEIDRIDIEYLFGDCDALVRFKNNLKDFLKTERAKYEKELSEL